MLLVCRLEEEVIISLSYFKNLRPDFASSCSKLRIAPFTQVKLSAGD